jgi:hypothetical protein
MRSALTPDAFCFEADREGLEDDDDGDREENSIDHVDKPVGKIPGYDHPGDQREYIPHGKNGDDGQEDRHDGGEDQRYTGKNGDEIFP